MIETITNRQIDRPPYITVGSFVTRKFTEEGYPDLALLAQRMHAFDYRASAFVTEDGMTDDGRLRAEIDTTRGPTVMYYIGQEMGNPDDAASTLRRKRIPRTGGGSIEELSAFSHTIGSFYPGEEEALRYHVDEFGPEAVTEVGALARAVRATSRTSMKLIRTAVHDAARENAHEKWMILFARPAYASMERFFGPAVARRVGHEALVSSGNAYINPKLSFVPAVIDPGQVLNILAKEIGDDTTDPRVRAIRQHAFRFMSEGADRGLLDDRALNLADEMAEEEARSAS